MKTSLFKTLIPVSIVFILLTSLLLIFKNLLLQSGFDTIFLLIANTILFLLSILGFFVQFKSVHSANTNAFIRGVYSSLLIKMFGIVAAIFIYIYISGGKVNQPSLFASMVFYLFYTFIEVTQLTKLARRKTNG